MMQLTKYEQETIILFNERDEKASVFTHNVRLQNIINKMCSKYPEQVRQTDGNSSGAKTYELPKKWIKIAAPRVLSEAQRQVLEEMNRRNRENGKQK